MSDFQAIATASRGLNFAIYHDRYQRTGDGWKFTERVWTASVTWPRSGG
jgi:hypothetical protein